MKATLYFYKTAINLIDKNFILESIESYLATLTPVTKTDFQYQRFELEKTIKVNMSQDYQLNIAGLTKYNYLKITTLDTSIPAKTATYYYFIKSARQVSELTIEFTIVMDVLNTFQFSSTAANDKYTLSDKTLVKREHKDRLSYKATRTLYLPAVPTASESTLISDFFNETWYEGTATIKFDFNQFVIDYNDFTPSGLTFPLMIYGNDTVLSLIIIKNDGEVFQNIIGSTIDIYEDKIYIGGLTPTTFYYSSLKGFTILINIFNSGLSGTPASFTGANELSYMKKYFSQDIVYNASSMKQYLRNVDYFQEGIGTQLFKKSQETLYDQDGSNQWYVVFASANAIAGTESVSSVKYVNPVKVKFYSDLGYSLQSSTSLWKRLDAWSPLIPKWKYDKERITSKDYRPSALNQRKFTINGTTYDEYDYYFVAVRKNNNDAKFEFISVVSRSTGTTTITYNNVDSIELYGYSELSVEGDLYSVNKAIIYIGSEGNSSTGSASKYSDLDLTDPLNIKAFAFPYCPLQGLVGKKFMTEVPSNLTWNADGFLELVKGQNANFKYQKTFNVYSPLHKLVLETNETFGTGKARNIEYESKLFHSDYYQPKFVYDSFSFGFNLEFVNAEDYYSNYNIDSFTCTYVVSGNVVSKFAFIFDEYVTNKSIQDYENVLTIERNNEKALFNNAYINYIRTGGYSYDTKKASSQNAVNGVTTALSIVGAIGSFASSGATGGAGIAAGVGLTISAAAGIIRAVHTAQEQDRAISQKILQTQMQGTSVQGSEDIDILTAFSGNKAKLVYYELSDRMKNAMWDLFHYCGYATHEQKVPAVDTRLYFNFVQAEIVLKDFTFNDEIAKRIIEKWNQGVTFMHWVSGAYDLNQEYENFETSLL